MSELLKKMTPEEKAEVEAFAAFVLTRRNLQNLQLLTDDISTEELLKLVEDSGSFEWLNHDEEDVYSLVDGEEAEWPSAS
ncbi:hypothetical protein GWN42_31745 [candidate division KSB1 bacterium]|nr:hypothetical protein [candidate division KSB1 bacterium]NIS23861.1 hypothetical protein [candidate division KSB1 bacterium]NIU24510.1 hypothetical protein [candidate division KSB1 bacterium]NIU94442.1 hypothetical protein [candidate division KSB1 bacterium]NIV97243.1 hypothetical protein [candidate division KSB1 bacterium]